MKKVLLSFILLSLPFFAATPAFATTFSDSFTDTNATELSAHNNQWVNVSGEAQIQSNELLANNQPAKYYWNGTYTSQNYKVCTDIKFIQSATNNYYLQYIRTDSGYSTWYRYYIQGNGTDTYDISLGKSLSGSESILDTATISASNDSVHTLCIGANDNNLSVMYDNSEVLSATDTTVTSGYAAIYQGDFPIDNFLIEDFTSDTKIAASPTSGNKIVGQPFNVDVKVEDSGEAFNAVRATVSVSSNLTVTGIHNATTNACNLQYTKTPTTSNPSFAGAIFGDSSTGCTVYTMTLTPNAAGTGTVSFSNGSVKAYADNSEIMTGVTNASFTLGNGNTPTPTPLLEFQVTNPLQTYKTNFNLTGTKLATITHIFVNGSEEDSTYPTSTTWEVPVTLNLGENNFTLYGKDESDNQTATQTTTVDRHTLGDINGDGEINLIDASLFAVDWDKTEDLTYILSDMNDDTSVDLTDLSILAKLE
jgi:hypothetical protein